MFMAYIERRMDRRMLCIHPGTEDGKPLPGTKCGYRLFLGQIVNRAMFEGMTQLGLGVDRGTNEPWMQFYGPFCSDRACWFDMVAPEASMYPMTLQACFSLANLKPEVPIHGTIMAVKGRKQLELDLDVEELDSFQLSWKAEFCERWRETIAKPYTGAGDPPRGVAAIRASRGEVV